MLPNSSSKFAPLLFVSLALAGALYAQRVERVVIIKVDGLPERLLEQYTREANPHLPNIAEIFGRNGSSVENFYVRGLSVSAPSWSMLDTGRHLEIHGNVEYDRYTLQPWDYLNFFPFYVGYARSKRVDMPAVELLDQQGVPLLIDRFPYQERYQGIQLLQRGIRWATLGSSLQGKFTGRPFKDLFDEWQTGFSMSASVNEATERDILRELKGTETKYLDYFTGVYDHEAHLTTDRVVQLHVLEALDSLVGRLWQAIAASPLADSTALVMVSDHGMNTTETTFSQGFSLVDWFNRREGGAHHVVTNRHPLTEFKLKGLDPFVSEVITPSKDSFYLRGKEAAYPTVVLDLDGNERATISLRENSLNTIQVLIDQLNRKRSTGALRVATVEALFRELDRNRIAWSREIGEVRADLISLRRRIEQQEARVAALPKKWTRSDGERGSDKDGRREIESLNRWRDQERTDSQYAAVMERLLALSPADFDPGKFKVEELIPTKSLGRVNTIHDLQHYVVGPSDAGMVLAPDGSLDVEQSFRRVNYFEGLSGISVRNNVQKNVSPNVVESIAVRVPREQLLRALPLEGDALEDGIWLQRSPEYQALILTRHDPRGRLELRYMPVSALTHDGGGDLHFEPCSWTSGFPLELMEDAALDVPAGESRTGWLRAWHDERTWLKAVHRTRYSNGIIGLTEALLDPPGVRETFVEHRRSRLRPDMIVFANEHWNFNVRGFNPGGNHGSTLRVSTHSVLLAAGGKNTGIPRGQRIETPYDSLSFVPTILSLMGKPEEGLPGPVIRELISPPSTR